MLGSIDRDDLLAALRRCAVVFGSHRAGGHVALSARGDELVLEAAVPDSALRTVVPLAQPGTGHAVVPLTVLDRYVSSVSGLVTLDVTDEATLTVAAGSSRARLHQITEAVLAAPRMEDGARGSLSATELLKLRRVMHAAATSDAQPVLSGVRFEQGHAIACDGYRLAATELNWDAPDTVVPTGFLRRIADEASPVRVRTSAQHVEFSSDTVTYWTKPIIGDYFDWRRLVPDRARTPERLDVDLEATLDAVRTIDSMGLTLGQQFGPRLLLERGDGVVVIRSHDEVGDVIAEVTGEMSVPSLAFNARYLRQSLEVLTGERLTGRLEGPARALIIEEDDFLQVLMPVRI